MKKITALLMLVPMLAFGAARGDVATGAAAYQRGDYREAFAEWERSAERGDKQALFRLGGLYEDGLGVPQNYVRAHMYYNLAGALGHTEARAARDALGARLTPDQLAKAQDMALLWRPMEEPVVEGQRSAEVSPGDGGGAEPADGSATAPDIQWIGQSSAVDAVTRGDVGALRSLLASGTDANLRLGNGDTLLIRAVKTGNARAARALLEAGADPNLHGRDGWSGLKTAIYDGDTALAKLLLRGGANPSDTRPDGMTALTLAQRLGNAELVLELSRAGDGRRVR